jgi:hypothetical protein
MWGSWLSYRRDLLKADRAREAALAATEATHKAVVEMQHANAETRKQLLAQAKAIRDAIGRGRGPARPKPKPKPKPEPKANPKPRPKPHDSAPPA